MKIEQNVDVAIVGAGFSGSLTALLLKQIGLRPVLVDKGVHPRFAIGESSTPLANLIIEDLARRYDLPRLAPLANYASWKQTYPEIVCGLKRGFSYFHQVIDHDFQPRADHANELLVAASSTAEDADTHWLRSDFDQFLAKEAVAAAIPYFDKTSIDRLEEQSDGWILSGRRLDQAVQIKADLIIDASGEGCFLAKQLGIGPHPDGLKTRSRALFSHFKQVALWDDLYRQRGGNNKDHPYPCDDAALHHVFDGGWMWVLRFDNQVTSAGFSLDPDRYPLDKSVAPETEWAALLERLPAVREQFAAAEPIVPFRQTGRMQRRLARAAGPNWVMLPNTAAFLDPLHSTGNAFTLVGIERLIGILERSWKRPDFAEELKRFDEIVNAEVDFLDHVVSGSFAGFRQFDRMVAMSMFYFSAATWSEAERRTRRAIRGSAFLSADHAELKAALVKATKCIKDQSISTDDFVSLVRNAIAPFNRVGLFNAEKKNLYHHHG